jgi:hypothetical protein
MMTIASGNPVCAPTEPGDAGAGEKIRDAADQYGVEGDITVREEAQNEADQERHDSRPRATKSGGNKNRRHKKKIRRVVAQYGAERVADEVGNRRRCDGDRVARDQRTASPGQGLRFGPDRQFRPPRCASAEV